MVQPEEPERLGRVLSGVLQQAGGMGLATLLEIRRSWPQWVGPDMAARARPVAFERGALTIRVEHAVFSQELRLREPELKRVFEARIGRRLDRLVFHTERTGVEGPSSYRPEEGVSRVESAASPPQTAAEARIRDPELREALASLRSHLRENEGE